MSFVKTGVIVLLAMALPFSVSAENQPAPKGPAMMGPGGGTMGQAPQHRGMGPGMGPGMMTPRPFAGVEFSEQQRKQISEMMAAERKSHKQRVDKMQQVQQQLEKLYMADKWDSAAITKLYEKMHAEQRRTIAAMAEARNKVVEMMSKEQREQMKKYQKEQLEQMKRFQQQQKERFATPPQPQQQPQPRQ